MTDLMERPQKEPTVENENNKRQVLALAAVIGVALLGFAAWYFVIRDTSPATVDSAEAAAERGDALAEAGSDVGAAAPASLDGIWSIDTTIGTFDAGCLTDACGAAFLGFRIDEELASIGAKTVVGRTPGVSGTMEISGTTITAATINADMAGLITDSGSRTNAIRNQAIETDAFPRATFVLTQSMELGTIPGPGEQVQVSATGDLTIHGVTRSETVILTAELAGDTIVVFGELGPILLADYNINKPSAAAVLSVEDNAIMELQLFLTK